VTEAPKIYTVVLPPSHPFWKMSDEDFVNLWGPHVRRIESKPIPANTTADAQEDRRD
jgi:lipopolysaccharide biosynthesis protein